MNARSVALIEKYFLDHGSDGEFVQSQHSVPYTLVPPINLRSRLIFTTKPRIVCGAIERASTTLNVAIMGRYGLPNRSDVKWIRAYSGARQILFLGDMDPVDLMVFSWLRGRLGVKAIAYAGIGDQFLGDPGLLSSLVIPCSATERKSIKLLQEVFPDFREVVGERCAMCLDRGQKIELEAVVSSRWFEKTFAQVVR